MKIAWKNRLLKYNVTTCTYVKYDVHIVTAIKYEMFVAFFSCVCIYPCVCH